ncbi:hypothetical protein BBC0178_011260 [Bartonella apihabitans]|uniref:Uncharacterized protein n=2 Tax=Bartonella apihabitans TaxID=2750929 RepID=A0A1U9MBC1_9HYPH|nr:hypothetical protein BBC0178_011260 [Bartonella apihabitans]
MIFATVIGGEALISKIMGKSVGGFSTLILVVLITGVAILSCFCVLSAYVRQIFYEVKNRPRYLISDQIGVDAEYGPKKEKLKNDAILPYECG